MLAPSMMICSRSVWDCPATESRQSPILATQLSVAVMMEIFMNYPTRTTREELVTQDPSSIRQSWIEVMSLVSLEDMLPERIMTIGKKGLARMVLKKA